MAELLFSVNSDVAPNAVSSYLLDTGVWTVCTAICAPTIFTLHKSACTLFDHALCYLACQTSGTLRVMFSLDHTTEQCEEYEPPEDTLRNQAKSKSSGQYSKNSRKEAATRQPICIKWNQSHCHSPTCEFQHICLECHLSHKARDCPAARR